LFEILLRQAADPAEEVEFVIGEADPGVEGPQIEGFAAGRDGRGGTAGAGACPAGGAPEGEGAVARDLLEGGTAGAGDLREEVGVLRAILRLGRFDVEGRDAQVGGTSAL
jgi:hypothetical protein